MLRAMWVVLLAGALVSPMGAQPQGPGAYGNLPRNKIGKMGRAKNAPMLKKRLDRLNNMNPEERQRFLDSLPPERRKVVERQLQRYQNLTPQQRERLARQYEQFEGLPPQKREQVRRLYGEFNALPPDRQRALRRETTELRRMSDQDREARMNSDEFRANYSVEERRLLGALSQALPPE